jgi:hypothetical protein
VMVKSIILEEEGHLEEMINQLKAFSSVWESHAQVAVNIEHHLFEDWAESLSEEVLGVEVG